MSQILWYGHSAFNISCDDKHVVVDPFLTPASGTTAETIGPVDVVLVTHDHADHVGDAVAICKNTGAMLGAIVGTAQKLEAAGVPSAQLLNYIGFNMESDLVSNPSVRYALSLAVDRQTAADSYMKDGATAAALPISPASPLYNGELASQLNYNLSLCAQVLQGAGVSDMDNDGRLEQLYASQLRDFELDLIVCSQSSGKGDVCNRFAEDMDSLGVTVNVRELSWSDYLSALHGDDLDGDGQPDVHFDMYYAEVKLGADFDLTALLTEEGSLNYGGITDSSYATYINDYLAADDLTRSSECYELLRYIAANAPIIPVCFERHEVITHRNVITGMNVTANNVFFNISDWTITFSDEDREEK